MGKITYTAKAFLLSTICLGVCTQVASAQTAGDNSALLSSAQTSPQILARKITGELANTNERDLNGFLNYFCTKLQLPDLSAGADIGIGGGDLEACLDLDIDFGFDFDAGIDANVNLCLNQLPNFEFQLNSFDACIKAHGGIKVPPFNIPNIDPNQLEACVAAEIPSLNLDLNLIANPLQWLQNYCKFFKTGTTGLTGIGVNYQTNNTAPEKVRFTVIDRGKKGIEVNANSPGSKTILTTCKQVKKGNKKIFRCQ